MGNQIHRPKSAENGRILNFGLISAIFARPPQKRPKNQNEMKFLKSTS